MKTTILAFTIIMLLFTFGCEKKNSENETFTVIDSTVIAKVHQVGSFTYHPPKAWMPAPKDIFDMLKGKLGNAIDDPNLEIEPVDLFIEIDTKSMLVISKVELKGVSDEEMVGIYLKQVEEASESKNLTISDVKRKGSTFRRMQLVENDFINIRLLTPASAGFFYQFDYISSEVNYKSMFNIFESSIATIGN